MSTSAGLSGGDELYDIDLSILDNLPPISLGEEPPLEQSTLDLSTDFVGTGATLDLSAGFADTATSDLEHE